MHGLTRRPGDVHLYLYASFTHGQILFSLQAHIFWVHKKVLRREDTPARAISFHGDSVAEDFIICVGPIESDWPHWESWKSTQ